MKQEPQDNEEPLVEEESEDEESDHGAQQPASLAFGARKLAKPNPAKPKATPKPSAAATSVAAVPARTAAAPAQPQQQSQPTETRRGAKAAKTTEARMSGDTEAAARSAGEAPATLVLDGRGQRLQENLSKSLDDMKNELQSLVLSTDSDKDTAEAKKARAQRNRQLAKHGSALKLHLKRVQESVNRAALTSEEMRILELQDVVGCCQTFCAALVSNCPDVDEMEAAFAKLQQCSLLIKVATDAHRKLHACRVGRFMLYRQFDEAVQLFRVDAAALAPLQQDLSQSAVEDICVLDVSTRLTQMLRGIPVAEAAKQDSDGKKQAALFSKTLLAEVRSQTGSHLRRLETSAALVVHLLDTKDADVATLQAALARVDQYAELPEGAELPGAFAEEERPILQFFVEHKIGMALAAHARSQLGLAGQDAKAQELLLKAEAGVESLRNVDDICASSLSQVIRPTWHALAEATKLATCSLKLQAETLQASFLDVLSMKTIADMQEAVLGFLEYVTEARQNGGWIARLDMGKDGPKESLDLAKVLQALDHVDNVMSGFWLELGKSLPGALKEQLQKDAFVRQNLKELTTFVFVRQGLDSALSLQKTEPTAEQLLLWSEDFQLAVSEILPAGPGMEKMEALVKDFFGSFKGPLVAELNSRALVAYRDIGSLVQLCLAQKNNKTSSEDAVQKILPQLPPSCSLRPLWSSFLDVAKLLHELHDPDTAVLEVLCAAMDKFDDAMTMTTTGAGTEPEKIAAMQLGTVAFQEFYSAAKSRKQFLLERQLELRTIAACEAGLVCVAALKQLPSPETEEQTYRSMMAAQVPVWASAAAASRHAAESVLKLKSVWHVCVEPERAEQVALSAKSLAVLLAAHVTFFAVLTLLRAPESGNRSAEGKANGKKMDALLQSFWTRDFPATPPADSFPHSHILKVLQDMSSAITRSIGKCSVEIEGKDCWPDRAKLPKLCLPDVQLQLQNQLDAAREKKKERQTDAVAESLHDGDEAAVDNAKEDKKTLSLQQLLPNAGGAPPVLLSIAELPKATEEKQQLALPAAGPATAPNPPERCSLSGEAREAQKALTAQEAERSEAESKDVSSAKTQQEHEDCRAKRQRTSSETGKAAVAEAELARAAVATATATGEDTAQAKLQHVPAAAKAETRPAQGPVRNPEASVWQPAVDRQVLPEKGQDRAEVPERTGNERSQTGQPQEQKGQREDVRADREKSEPKKDKQSKKEKKEKKEKDKDKRKEKTDDRKKEKKAKKDKKEKKEKRKKRRAEDQKLSSAARKKIRAMVRQRAEALIKSREKHLQKRDAEQAGAKAKAGAKGKPKATPKGKCKAAAVKSAAKAAAKAAGVVFVPLSQCPDVMAGRAEDLKAIKAKVAAETNDNGKTGAKPGGPVADPGRGSRERSLQLVPESWKSPEGQRLAGRGREGLEQASVGPLQVRSAAMSS